MTTARPLSRWTKLAVAAALAGCLSACALPGGAPGERAALQETNDPLEPFNRAVFAFNEQADKLVFGPLSDAYRFATPQIARDIVRNVVNNMLSPITIANNLLQGNFEGAGKATGRFLTNTVLGAGGIADVAAEAGNPHAPEDFGQTLGVWGVGEGPYLFLPILGPSNLRDFAGYLVDSAADPVRVYATANSHDKFLYERVGADSVDKRARLGPVIDDLRANSVDYYATVRSLYRQRRSAEIGGAPPRKNEDFPVFDSPPPAK